MLDHPGKAAHDIPAYLQNHGYRVIPVNPFTDEILGETAYDSLAEVPGEIDIVDVFRPSDEVRDIVDAALERDDDAVIWLQLGSTTTTPSNALRRLADASFRTAV